MSPSTPAHAPALPTVPEPPESTVIAIPNGDRPSSVRSPDFGVPLPRTPRKTSSSPQDTLGSEVDPVIYFEHQHATWARLCGLQAKMTEGRSCQEYALGRASIDALCHRIPSLPEIDAWLSKESGWRIVRADGYVDPPDFLAMLADKHFPCMDQIRHEDEIFYSPAPDMYHDIIGHLPMVCRPQFCEYYELFGRAGSRVRHAEQYKMLNRLYWYTMEFGLICEKEGETPKAYGAALLTGLGELVDSVGDAFRRRPFSLDEVLVAPTDVDRPNDTLYVISSYDDLFSTFVDWARSERLL